MMEDFEKRHPETAEEIDASPTLESRIDALSERLHLLSSGYAAVNEPSEQNLNSEDPKVDSTYERVTDGLQDCDSEFEESETDGHEYVYDEDVYT